MGPFSKAMLHSVAGWLKKQQKKITVCCSPKLGIAPVTSLFIFPRENINILYYGLKKKNPLFQIQLSHVLFTPVPH